MTHLFEPLKLRDVVLPNRIGIPPMCQYSACDGMPSEWHFVHYGSRAVGGAGLLLTEAIGVTPEGRITPGDLGLWDDAQIAPLARIVRFCAEQGSIVGVQLGHSGRKGGIGLGWQAQQSLSAEEGGWTTVAPSPIAFGTGYASPRELAVEEIPTVIASFVAATRRAREAGCQVVEIHAAHGYLLHQFLSPLSNRRTDHYGGSFENRTRLVSEVVAAVREAWPERLPLLVRLSATDWVEGGWNAEETVELCRTLKALGVDLIDVSSGGLVPTAVVPAGPGFQASFATRIRREANLPTAAVGLITSAEQADHLIRSEQADLALLGREMLRDPYWPLHAAKALGHPVAWPKQYLRAAPGGSQSR